ncbi:hypothetical protein L3X38_037574 [Prunus dulcis]|uniref:Uncharacterized protein n=1 Tax=Prunus dulcis TaxID=3755 RepID=A0AAD4V5T1_PRUDU|nr:hypothetical protein L3X38_037574 [Prunus dulcis]
MLSNFSVISIMVLTILTVFLVVLPLLLPPLPPPPLVLLFVPVLIMAVLILLAFSPLSQFPDMASTRAKLPCGLAQVARAHYLPKLELLRWSCLWLLGSPLAKAPPQRWKCS